MDPMNKLYPALTQCFAVILCGYLAGRFNLLPLSDSKGLNTFVSYFSLPSLIFLSLSSLDFSSVNWIFLSAIFCSKSIIFVSVIVITLLVRRSWSRAGLYGIFATQSNDFAVGFPIVEALYKDTHPSFPSYLYLMAPISLAVLNPIGLILMEIGKKKESNRNEESGRRESTISDEIEEDKSKSYKNLNGTKKSNNERNLKCENEDELISESQKIRQKRKNKRQGDISDTIYVQGLLRVEEESDDNETAENQEENDTSLNFITDSSENLTSHVKNDRKRTSNEETEESSSRSNLYKQVLKGVFLNPVLIMTVLGIIGNFIFKHQIPDILKAVLQVLGSSFSATALFLLGLRMVGKVHKLKGAALLTPVVLIITKLLVLPLITRETVSLFLLSSNSANTTGVGNSSENTIGNLSMNTTTINATDWSSFGFLYGSLPSAPTVFVFACQYQLEVDLVATSLALCTFASAPSLFTSIRMLNVSTSTYVDTLKQFSFEVCVASSIVSIWNLVTFVINGRIKKSSYQMTAFLVVAQFLTSLSLIINHFISSSWIDFFSTSGNFSERFLSTGIAVTLVFLECRSLDFASMAIKVMIALGFSISVLLSLLLTLLEKQPGLASQLSNVCVLLLAFIVTTGSIILHQRHRRHFRRYSSLANEPLQPGASTSRILPSINQDIEDIAENTCPSRFTCTSFGECVLVHEDNNVEQVQNEADANQILKHVVLLLFILSEIFVSLSVSIWTLILETPSGIFTELSFLAAALHYGQPFVILALFGLDSLPIEKLLFWKKIAVQEHDQTNQIRRPCH